MTAPPRSAHRRVNERRYGRCKCVAVRSCTGGEPRRYSWVVVACAATLGVLGGVCAARSWTAPVAAHGALDAAAASARNAPHTPEDWLARAATTAGKLAAPALQQELTASLAGDPALRKAVIEHYSHEARRAYRVTIKDMLVASRLPNIAALALDLAKRDDSLARAAGFELLASLPPGAESLALARTAIANETDAVALAGALMALQPLGPPPRGEARAILPRLVELTRHPDPLVRAHAVQRVAEWDKLDDQTTSIVLYALSDGDRLVRQAAVGAAMIGRLRSEAVKLALLRAISDTAEDLTIRGASLHALLQFSLSDDEQTRYLAARSEIVQASKAR